MRFGALVIGSALAAASSAYVETFENGVNLGGWSYGTGGGFIENSGGNPGAYFHEPQVDTFAPQPHTEWGTDSPFTGNYRAANVGSVGIDLILFAVDFSAEGRPLSVILIDDNGTPSDFDDDWGAYLIGKANVPLVGEGWKSFSFDIDSQSVSLPNSWQTIQFGPNSPQNPDWNALITDVEQLRFFYGDPTNFFIFQMWNVGMDNAAVNIVPEPGGVLILAAMSLAAMSRELLRRKLDCKRIDEENSDTGSRGGSGRGIG
jgi:hypothetical protein